MSLLNSYSIGMTGLQASSKKMSSVSDNISNSQTAGFKKSNSEFEEVLTDSMNDHSNSASNLGGVRESRVKSNFDQGELARTSSATDMAINGKGFFKLQTPFGQAYSRDGSFHFNKDGELVNSDGHKVLGYQVDENGKRTNKQLPIKLNQLELGAKSTSSIKMTYNFDARERPKVFDQNNPDATSNFSRVIEVFDSKGASRHISVYFNKVSETQWQYNAMIDGKDYQGGVAGQKYSGASGTIDFNEKGELLSETSLTNSFNFKDSDNPAQSINFDFGPSLNEGGDGRNATTHYGTKTSVSKMTKDGSKAATMSSMNFGPNGTLQAFFDNGEVKDVAQLMIADFTNEQGLRKVGGNLFVETSSSGQATLGAPGEEGRGEVLSKSIELSNVDMSTELVDLLETQRTFTANSKAMSVSDELLRNVINVRG
ncbi:flagellar hook protein FlgE [Halobacteriovorax sp. GB3]|uniref:flagellar hook protein FlgE n=1 Tax=Halobacteriovorax sp. GB3 TaxID=2719615 RepID=UPI00235E90DE|nr:flagellar hook protein FlgE [Halobacteriovorax sp. GB3]MDD0853363.1 flagellar hook protein FlgE [Halobacteriovorax sp. GB3]